VLSTSAFRQIFITPGTKAWRPLCLVLVLGISGFAGWPDLRAQEQATGESSVYGATSGPAVLTSDELFAGLTLHTQGAGVSLRRAVFKNAEKARLWGADLVYLRHPKEEKTTNPAYEDGRPYVYGKVNAFHMFRLLAGGQTFHSVKLRRDAVRFATSWNLGPSIGLLKPVYLLIGYTDIPYDYLATERYNPNEHYSDDIYGAAPWSNGLDEIGFVPGLHASYSVDFEYGSVREEPRSFSVGAAVDGFLWQPEIIANRYEQNRLVFVTLFARIEVGKRWTD